MLPYRHIFSVDHVLAHKENCPKKICLSKNFYFNSILDCSGGLWAEIILRRFAKVGVDNDADVASVSMKPSSSLALLLVGLSKLSSMFLSKFR